LRIDEFPEGLAPVLLEFTEEFGCLFLDALLSLLLESTRDQRLGGEPDRRDEDDKNQCVQEREAECRAAGNPK
jgi:hypothetical protein